METKLYQEETEIAGGGVMTPQERADKAAELIAASGFRIERGHGWVSGCMGCALGALVFSLGYKGMNSHEDVLKGACSTGLLSLDEALQLEFGYEDWSSSLEYPVVADKSSPFYRLGRSLRRGR